MIASAVRTCVVCRAPLVGKRTHAECCSATCRMRKLRAERRRWDVIPENLAEQAWDAAGGDGELALLAALAIVERLEQVAA